MASSHITAMTRITSIRQLSETQKDFVLAFDPGILTRVAQQVRKSRTAVHLVFRNKTKKSPIVTPALLEELARTLKRIEKELPPGSRRAFQNERRGA